VCWTQVRCCRCWASVRHAPTVEGLAAADLQGSPSTLQSLFASGIRGWLGRGGGIQSKKVAAEWNSDFGEPRIAAERLTKSGGKAVKGSLRGAA